MNRVTLASQQQPLDAKGLTSGLPAATSSSSPLNVATSVAALSNSPASPLASPSSSSLTGAAGIQTATAAQTMIGDACEASTAFASNPNATVVSSVASSIFQGTHGGLIGSQELHEALEAACCQAANTLKQQDTRFVKDSITFCIHLFSILSTFTVAHPNLLIHLVHRQMLLQMLVG